MLVEVRSVLKYDTYTVQVFAEYEYLITTCWV